MTKIEEYIKDNYLRLDDEFVKQKKKYSNPNEEEEAFQEYVYASYQESIEQYTRR